MILRSPKLSLCLLTLAPPLWAFESSSHRRFLKPSDNIGQKMAKEHANGNARPHVTIQAKIAGSDSTVEYNLREAMPAVTGETTISSPSEKGKVNANDLETILVSDDPAYFALVASNAATLISNTLLFYTRLGVGI
mmetsp:Transcript_27516/g.58125  ORF Transcript_27516/g.58125 Transcript_27516/m.58125 type:complete len:136 (+) Transcript_27516:176-583(+)